MPHVRPSWVWTWTPVTINASLEFLARNSGWYAILQGRNLTDRLYRQTVIRADPLVGIKHFWGAPRTIGLTIGYRS